MKENEKNKKPSIFEYKDYRLFLQDLYAFLKETTDYFSYRYFSKKAGFSSPNYLKLVIEGKRNISDASIEKFALAFKLNKAESQFLKKLVAFNQTQSNSERAQFAMEMVKTKMYQKMNPLTKEQMDYYSQWYLIGIRELTLCKNFEENLDWIAGKFYPALNPKEVKNGLETLQKLGLLARDKNGKLIPAEQNLGTSDEVCSSFVTVYHKQMMSKAQDSLDTVGYQEREISSICTPVSQSTFHKMKTRIQEFRKELMAMADADTNPERVYQLNLQFFPLTKGSPSED